MPFQAISGSVCKALAGTVPALPPVFQMPPKVADVMPDFSIRHTTSGARKNAPSGALSSLRGQVYTDSASEI
jgi:hypothetical protein